MTVRPYTAAMRKMVFERDRGVCTECGLDAEALRRELMELPQDARRIRERELRWPSHRMDYWDADHRTPVAEQGPTTLENLRTLCLPCHRSVTDAYMASRPQAPRPPRPRDPRVRVYGMPMEDGRWWQAAGTQPVECPHCGEWYDDAPAVMRYIEALDFARRAGSTRNWQWAEDGWVVWREHEQCGWRDWREETVSTAEIQRWNLGPWRAH